MRKTDKIDSNKFKTFTSELKHEVTGKHDVYFCFNGQNITAGHVLFNFDWWNINNIKQINSL